jgi:hypothetical protein
LSVSDRESPRFTVRSGTQRARRRLPPVAALGMGSVVWCWCRPASPTWSGCEGGGPPDVQYELLSLTSNHQSVRGFFPPAQSSSGNAPQFPGLDVFAPAGPPSATPDRAEDARPANAEDPRNWGSWEPGGSLYCLSSPVRCVRSAACRYHEVRGEYFHG